MNLFMKSVDGLNSWIGRIVGWVMIFIMFITVYDVLARRLFNVPLQWGFDVSVQLFGLHFMIVAAYTLLHNEHVSIDIFKNRLVPRARAMLEIVSYLIFFFPFMALLLYYGLDFAGRSWETREVSWAAVSLPMYYFKSVIPATAILLILQGICKMVRLLAIVREGDDK